MSPQQAFQMVVNAANAAPLQNMQHAAQLSEAIRIAAKEREDMQAELKRLNTPVTVPAPGDANELARAACATHDPTDFPAEGSPLLADSPAGPEFVRG